MNELFEKYKTELQSAIAATDFEDVILAVQMQLIDLHKSCLNQFLA